MQEAHNSAPSRMLHGVPLYVRGILFVVVTLAVFTWSISYDRARMLESGPENYPPPNFLGSTWYGALVLLVSPMLLFWVTAATKRPWGRALGLFFSILLLIVCLLAIWIAMSAVSTLPGGIPRYNGV